MRNYLFVFSSIFMLFACKKANTNDGSSITKIPISPVNLTGKAISSTQVDLNWTDQSDNEGGFKVQRKTGTGNFTDITSVGKEINTYSDKGLSPNTVYVYRVYAFNIAGVSANFTNERAVLTYGPTPHSCGAINVHNYTKTYGTVTDIDGNTYKTIQINTQTWMAENLKTTRYKNGVSIANVTDNTQWEKNTTGAYSSYNNDISNDCPYGKLYNQYAILNNNKLCPDGWHVPSDQEWVIMGSFLTGTQVEFSQGFVGGYSMKSEGLTYWQSPNVNVTNSSGFSAIPAGFRELNGAFQAMGRVNILWTSSELYSRFLSSGGGTVQAQYGSKNTGYSVRCIKD